MDYTFSKTTAERYIINTHHDQVRITITEDGDLNIQGGYGEYGHAWRAFGDNFKEFLSKLDSSYLLGKLATKDYFNFYDWLVNAKEIIKADKYYCYTEDEKNELINELENIGDYNSVDLIQREIMDNSTINEIAGDELWYCDWFPENEYSPQALIMCNEIFIIFQKILLNELAEMGCQK